MAITVEVSRCPSLTLREAVVAPNVEVTAVDRPVQIGIAEQRTESRFDEVSHVIGVNDIIGVEFKMACVARSIDRINQKTNITRINNSIAGQITSNSTRRGQLRGDPRE